MDQMQAFYDAITARYEDAMAYCDKFAIDDMPEDATNLMHMLYSMVMVLFPVECWARARSGHGRVYSICWSNPGPEPSVDEASTARPS